jgi:2-succinyl-5-enolpyruvyl-6-hydroxy-3-cyclohexene-1-carboxylate synthase
MPDITDWWRNQETLNTKYTDLANVARDIFFIMPHRVGVKASISRGWDVIGWRQSKTTGQILCEKVVVHQFARSNAGPLAGNIPITHPLDPDNDAEMKKEAEQKKLQRMAKVHDFLDMWQDSENLCSTQKATRTKTRR